MSSEPPLAGRSYIPQVYGVQGRRDLHAFMASAIEESGGRVVYASPATRAPFVFGIQTERDDRLCVIAYAFRCNAPPIRGRASDEHRVQIRYGGETSWGGAHPVARDPAGSDVTVVVGVHPGRGALVGLDPLLYADLPMGISVEFKDDRVATAHDVGWAVWERDNISGVRRRDPRAAGGLEALVAFRADRLLRFVEFERQASALGLDPPLRYRAAERAGRRTDPAASTLHDLEEEFDLSAREILDIVSDRNRLGVALRGGVAEHHLGRALAEFTGVVEVRRIDEDGRHDFDVVVEGRAEPVRVECKNCSPHDYANGDHRVEVQKTRGSKGDPTSRFYRTDQFDVVAACLYPPTGEWAFRFKRTDRLTPHEAHRGRVAALQRVDETWTHSLREAL